LSSEEDLQIVSVCKQNDLGLIAMKALSSGLITNAATTFTFLRQYDNVVPIWGMEKESQLDQFVAMEKNPPALDEQMKKMIAHDRNELSRTFCRACGYCMPCPAGIQIPTAGPNGSVACRMPYQQFMTEEWRDQMLLIEKCRNCGQCKKHWPYQLDTPQILRGKLKEYQ
jgi:uncharacterized protein